MANFDEVQAAIDSADDLTKLGAACKTAAQSLGFSHFLLGFRVPLSLEKPYQLIYSSYPKLWRKHYDDNRYFTVDPVVRRALTTSVPFAWEDLEADSPEAVKLFEEAARFGLTHGIAVPVHGASGSGALLTMARTKPLPDRSEERHRLMLIALWHTARLHDRLRSVLLHGNSPKFGKLTPRERQCLKLAASGLSAGLISRQIDISERTVIYYLGRAEEKLGVRTRQHAIARAIFLGELEPDCYPMLISQSQKVIDIGN